MSTIKIAITVDRDLLDRIDELVERKQYPNRSRAVQDAIRDKLDRLKHGRLARECAKLDPDFEKTLADEGLLKDGEVWPEY